MKPKSLEKIVKTINNLLYEAAQHVDNGEIRARDIVRGRNKLIEDFLKSYALWLIEEGEPEMRTSEELEKVYSGHMLIDIWKKNDLYNSAISDYKQNLKKLIEQD